MTPLARIPSEHPHRVLAVVAVLTLVALAGIVGPVVGGPGLRIDPSLEKLVPDGETALRESLGDAGGVVVAVEGPADEDVFTRAGLARVARMEDRLLSLDGVRSVTSLLRAAPIRDAAPELADATASELLAAREAVLADPLYAGNLVSRDGRVAVLHVALDAASEVELLESGIDRDLPEAARQAAPEARVSVAGAPFLKAEVSRILSSELVTQVPIVLGIMLVVSFFAFRTWTGAWLPTGTIALALVWTLGVMAWLGLALNVVTSIIPPLILVVGFAYAVHVVAENQAIAREASGQGRDTARQTSRRALARVALPVSLTCGTTAAGFLSLGISPIDVIREFGALGAVGVAAAGAAALTFAPAVLALAPPTRPRRIEARERWVDRALRRVAEFDLRHRHAILATGLAVFVVSLVGTLRIEVDTRVVENFRADAPIRVDYERVNALLDGADVFRVKLEAPPGASLLEPGHLRTIAKLQDWLAAQPEIGGTTSIVDHLRAIHRAMRGPEAGLPESQELAAQLLWLGESDQIGRFIDARREQATVIVRSRATSSHAIASLVERVEGRVADLDGGLGASVSGGTIALTRAVDDVSRGQARSLAAAFAVIYAILALYFRSAALGLAALIPNALPVAVYFGTLGFAGIHLNNATALLGCVVLGIAVDDTLHLVVRHRQASARLRCAQAAASEALAKVGRPVTWTTIGLCLGLSVLTSSDLATQAQFGALGAFTLAVAWITDLILTPALCSMLPLPGRRARRRAGNTGTAARAPGPMRG